MPGSGQAQGDVTKGQRYAKVRIGAWHGQSCGVDTFPVTTPTPLRVSKYRFRLRHRVNYRYATKPNVC